MKKILLISLLFSLSSYSQDYILEKITAPEGYILSLDLEEKDCINTWTEQIERFKKNNPNIKDPDLILIGQEIIVQNCMESQLYRINKKDNWFIVGSYLRSHTESQGNDEIKRGEGFKLELGRSFNLGSNNTLRISVSMLRMRFDYHNHFLDGENAIINTAFIGSDISYLFNLSEKLKIGPNLGILYNPYGAADMTDVDEEPYNSGNKISPLGGVNINYSIDKKISIDSKIGNRFEDRNNSLFSLGLEYKF